MIDILIRIMADGLVVGVVLLGAWALLFQLNDKNRVRAYSRVLIAGLTAYLLAKLAASIFQPELERPFQQLGEAAGALYLNNPGFPSDHVLFSTAIFWAVWFEGRSRTLAIIIGVLTLCIGLGRVIALVHTPLDVVGGLVIASIGALWYLQPAEHKPIRAATRIKRKNKVQ